MISCQSSTATDWRSLEPNHNDAVDARNMVLCRKCWGYSQIRDTELNQLVLFTKLNSKRATHGSDSTQTPGLGVRVEVA